ncbi:MAG: ISL3 family transposase [Oscillospiraceae bacterium]|nr:ISL3 family transposase [Oscillospiraceae bacterium]
MLYEDNTAKLLGLEDVIVKKVWDEEQEKHIMIELPRRMHVCPCCGTETDQIHDYRMQRIKDIASFGKNVYLHLRKRRYVCGSCGKRFYEKNNFLPRYHRMTNRKNARIIEDFRDTVSASYIAKKHNISVSTALRYFNLVFYSCKKLPEVLSIDEFKGNADGEKYQTILTDPKNRKIMDILPNRKESDLIRYFRQFKNREEVKYFIMDMNPHFREVAENCFPKATIVIDRYHVTRQVIWALERVRKEVQKHLPSEWRRFCKHSKALLNKPPQKLTDEEWQKLRIILGLSTRLEQAYYLKNDFLFLMHSPNSELAEELLSHWIIRAESAHLPEFYECTRAIHNWSKYILNSFDVRYTNGFTEGCNNKTKVLKRVCYGVRNFARFRNRILHCAA